MSDSDYENYRSAFSERNWGQLSPGKENTALMPIVSVGLAGFVFVFAFVAVLWKTAEHQMNKAPSTLALSAHGSSVATHKMNHRRKHHSGNDIARGAEFPEQNTSTPMIEGENKAINESTGANLPGSEEQGLKQGDSAQVAGLGSQNELKAVRTQVRESTISALTGASATEQNHVPVGPGEYSKDGITVNSVEHRITSKNLLVKFSDDANLHLEKSGILLLRNGDALVDTAKPLLVKVGAARILLKCSSAVLISIRNDIVKVRNLQENRRGSAEIFWGSRRFPLAAGGELLAAPSFDRLGGAAGTDGVKRRCIHTFDLADGTNIMCAEFSPVNVIKNTPALIAMNGSSSKEESKSFDKIMKMAACLAVVTGGHGAYTAVSPGQSLQLASASLAN